MEIFIYQDLQPLLYGTEVPSPDIYETFHTDFARSKAPAFTLAPKLYLGAYIVLKTDDLYVANKLLLHNDLQMSK